MIKRVRGSLFKPSTLSLIAPASHGKRLTTARWIESHQACVSSSHPIQGILVQQTPGGGQGSAPPSGGNHGSSPPNGNDGDGRGRRKRNHFKREEEAKKDAEKTSAAANEPIQDGRSSKKESSTSVKNLATISIPKEYPQLLGIPLTKRPLFPGFYKSIYLKDPKAIAAVQSLLERRQPYVGIFLAKDHDSEDDIITSVDQIHPVGVFAQITNVYQSGPDNKSLTIVVYPHRRIKAEQVVKTGDKALPVERHVIQDKKDGSTIEILQETQPQPLKEGIHPVNAHLGELQVGLLNVVNLQDEKSNPNDSYIRAFTSEILNVLKEISAINPIIRDQVVQFSIQTGGDAFTDPAKLADFSAALCQGEPNELQSVIECLDLRERLSRSLVVLKKELANTNLQRQISMEVDKKINRKQQEYFLMEQLKGIKKELGMDADGKDKLIETFKKRAEKLNMSEAVKKVFDEELNKLQHLESAASEFNVTRNYLDWLTQLPWGKRNAENFNIDHALTVLDQDHYGLKDVKDRILEFIAVGKLRQNVEGKIICFVGPPGVGKTSIGKSIARALGREFYRFSVGGLTDVAEIKGHRRTYVGAMPGKVVQALKKVQSENPLIMIDEIDKLGRGHQGDPASALLELLDPEQNSSFLDHYMDVPMDLSKVLFVCTANVTETIPGPLLDRMEVITLSGYVAEEKLAIATKYLGPAAEKDSGLEGRGVDLRQDAILELIKFWCRESGVRNLKKHIEKIYRKAALMIVRKEQELEKDGKDNKASMEPLVITKDNLKDYVGSAIFTTERMYDTTPPGVVMGLAWTSMGGSPLYIESVLESSTSDQGKPQFKLTGQLGDVMKESSSIAYTYAKSWMLKNHPDNKFFDVGSIHLHVPEGATPKDGPSAGCTMTTALISLALNKPVVRNLAMTGEITLTGKILKIGGVKEKTIAAKRSGVETIIFPLSNKPDWEELPDYIRAGIRPIFVESYEDIFKVAIE